MQAFRRIKDEIRIIAFDDGPFEFGKKGKCILVGVIFRGGSFMDGLLKTDIEIDGSDAQEKIIKSVKGTRHKDIRLIMLDGITFGGFNTVDIKELYKQTGLPVIVVNRKKPDFERFKAALKKLPHAGQRLQAVESAGPVFWVKLNGKRVCFQCTGLNIKEAEKIIKLATIHSLIPEPLRVAHLIATGIVLGESVGRA